jgi:hypothetical protein
MRYRFVTALLCVTLSSQAFSAGEGDGPDKSGQDVYKRGLIGVVQSPEGDTHVVLCFNSTIDRKFWTSRVNPLMAGKYSTPPTAIVRGVILCKSNMVMKISAPPNECQPASITVDGKRATGIDTYPLEKGAHNIEIDFGRHNADKFPGSVIIKATDGRIVPFYYTQEMRDMVVERMPEKDGKKATPKVVVTP